MKIFNAIDLLKSIHDPALYEVICEGFMSIYETHGDMLNNEELQGDEYFNNVIDKLPYPDALNELKQYSADAVTMNEFAKKIGPIANKIALTQVALSRGEYATAYKTLEANMNDDDITEFLDDIKRLDPIFTGHNTLKDYVDQIEPANLAHYIKELGSVDTFVNLSNAFIYYDKLNDLLHDIKHEVSVRMTKKVN